MSIESAHTQKVEITMNVSGQFWVRREASFRTIRDHNP